MRSRAFLVGLFAVISSQVVVHSSMDQFPPSRYPFSMHVEEIPQFITITFDDGISAHSNALYQKYLFTAHDNKRGCPPRFTCFTSFDWSECDAIQFLLQSGSVEFAHHTQSHALRPNASEIQSAMESLMACGVPRKQITGFRAPYLTFDESMLDHVHANHAVYDATVVPDNDELMNYGRENQWPFTLEQGWNHSKIKCGRTGNCTEYKAYPGLWEIPLYPWFDTNDHFLTYMDYPTFPNDVQQNFERRYFGNRAPFGIYLHAPWLETYGSDLYQWIQQTMDHYDDVYFVTNMDLLAWMKHPVPKSEYIPPSCHPSKRTNVKSSESKAPDVTSRLKSKVHSEKPHDNTVKTNDEPTTTILLSSQDRTILLVPLREILFFTLLGPLFCLFVFVKFMRQLDDPQDVMNVERVVPDKTL